MKRLSLQWRITPMSVLLLVVDGVQGRFHTTNWYITAAVTMLSGILAYFVSGRALKPLRSFTSQVELFSAEHPDVRPETAEFLTLLREQTERLTQMTRTLLEMSNLRQVAQDWGSHWYGRSPISTAAPFGWRKARTRARPSRWSCRQGQKAIPPARISHNSPRLIHGDRFSTSATLSQQLSISFLSWVSTRMVLPFRASLFSLSATRRIFCPSRPLVAHQGSVSCGRKRWRRRWQGAASARRTGRTDAHPCTRKAQILSANVWYGLCFLPSIRYSAAAPLPRLP